MSITITKLMFAVPMVYFLTQEVVQYIKCYIEGDPGSQKVFKSMLFFFMTVFATIFYKGKGAFAAFTLNTKGVISLIMLVTPFVLDFISMWIDRKEKM